MRIRISQFKSPTSVLIAIPLQMVLIRSVSIKRMDESSGLPTHYPTWTSVSRLSRLRRTRSNLCPVPSAGSCALGRPWNNASRSIYKNTYMSDVVLPAGFIEWQSKEPRLVPNLTFFGEYGSYGPGYKRDQRNQTVGALLSQEEADQYTVEKVFGGMPSWIDLGTATIQ